MTDALPLTPVQQGMLYESALSDRPWLNLEQIVCHLEDEPVDPIAMQAAFDGLLAAHPVLRFSIDMRRGDPVQRPREVAQVPLTVEDWSGQDAAATQNRLAAFLAADRARGVDPSAVPAFRATLVLCGPRRAILVWTFPHTLLDGRSFAPLLDELFTRYGGPVPAVPENDAFARHCRALKTLSHDAGIAHFTQLLAGFEGAQGLVRHDVEPARKVIVRRDLAPAHTTRLAELAERTGVTFATLVLTAWGLVLGRWNGQGDAVFGVTRTGRHLVEGARDAIGCFITTLPARVMPRPGQQLAALLSEVRAAQIAQRPFEQVPLIEIKRNSDVHARLPLFESLVMFENGTLQDQLRERGGAWATRRVELHEEGDLPLTLAVYRNAGLRVQLEHDPARVPEADRLADHMMRLLGAMADAAPQTEVCTLDMLGAEERATLKRWGTPENPVTGTGCCITAFERAATLTPDKVAVEQPGSGMLSFAALDRAANRLAHLLRERGVGAGDVVGLCLPRSPVFVVALLAVWKAGGAFVPMDPFYPAENLRAMCADSGAVLVLGGGHLGNLSCPVLALDDDPAAAFPDTAPLRPKADPARLAYIIFTSGSTGRPKGVMVSQGSLSAHAAAVTDTYDLVPGDRVLQFASLSFDVALEEIVPTLLAGATLVLRTPDMAESGRAFLDRCDTLGLTVLNLPTGFWTVLGETLERTQRRLPGTVRLTVVGGERVPAPALRRWFRQVRGVRWINGYGPTETTITCTAHELGEAPPPGDGVPIGRPLGHATARVLAPDGSLAPQGRAGELWISGPAVALGYVGHPGMSAARFPVLAGDDGTRSYGTGDRVRWLADGTLDYLGRADRQVKLRGFRIEPGQIEQILERQPGVGQAHVAVLNPMTDTARLVAWVSGSDAGADPDLAAPDLAALRRVLQRDLPPHMRPVLISVADWPQTPGGKVDVARLPLPTAEAGDRPEQAPPTDPRTREIAAMMAGVLGRQGVGADDSFFDLGGHSLSLLRLTGMVEDRFGRRLTMAAVQADPTPRGLSHALNNDAADSDPLVPMAIQPGGTRVPLYGVHVLGVNGSFFRPLAAAMGPDQPVFGLTVGLLNDDTPVGVEATARFYFEQIQQHRPDGPVALAAVSLGSYVAYELVQQLVAAGRRVVMLALLDAEGPGGRPRVGRLARLALHGQKLRAGGRSYLFDVLRHKRETLRHRREKARLERQERNGADAVPAQTVEEFVAANERAVDAYDPQPYPRRLTVVRAEGSVFDSPESVETALGWSALAEGGLDLIEVPGDHLSILEDPNVTVLARELRRAMDRALRRPVPRRG